jgi:aerobic carbon-monoxide dehydrogenase medium subunit
VTGYSYARPASLEAAIDLSVRAGGSAYFLAGGTALGLLQRQGLIEPGLIVDLAAIPGLDAIEESEGVVSIGALCTLRRVERDPIVARRIPALAATIRHVASVRVRNQATLGGNLAHADPAQDPPPVLLVLDARLRIAGPGGQRSVPLGEFFVDVFETVLGPGEIVTHIDVPGPTPASRVAYEKFLPRTVDDYATVSVAARIDRGNDGRIADARIALGAVGPVPLRIPAAEALLQGRAPGDIDLEAMASAVRDRVEPEDDVRGSATYKREMAGVWTRRVVGRLLDPGSEAAG